MMVQEETLRDDHQVLQLILRGAWMSESNLMPIHAKVELKKST